MSNFRFEMNSSHKCFLGGRCFSSDIKSPIESWALALEDTPIRRSNYLRDDFISNLKFEISDALAFVSGLTHFVAHNSKFRVRILETGIFGKLLKRNAACG